MDFAGKMTEITDRLLKYLTINFLTVDLSINRLIVSAIHSSQLLFTITQDLLCYKHDKYYPCFDICLSIEPSKVSDHF